MIGLAKSATYLTLFSLSWAIVSFIVGFRTQNRGWVESGRRAVVASFAFVTFAAVILVYALVTNIWEIEYVWRTSLDVQPFIYKVGALWGGMSGSMLFWMNLLVLCGALMVWRRKEDDTVTDYALLVISIVSLFFAILAAGLIPGVKNPFTLLAPEQIARIQSGEIVRGLGLNPLLQTPSMLYHPPFLYLGFVSATVPFSYAMAALMTGMGSSQWILRSRRWTLASWLFLTFGNLFGGGWAYEELGWGGYWGWDPVENAALMPWLMITAFLHSVMIQEHRNMLKIWNILLISLTFLLTIFGTMLVRSGILSSIHAFGESEELLIYFVGFLLVVVACIGVLMFKRAKQLKSVNSFDSLLSRESAFLMNNWIFVVCAVVVLAGTTFPIISKAYYFWTQGIEKEITVSEPFYNQFIVPIGVILLFLTGIGPMISWKKATPSNLKRNFLMPLAAGLVGAAVMAYPLYALGMSDPSGFSLTKMVYSLLCVYASLFVLATVVVEYWKGIRVRRNRGTANPVAAAVELTLRNKRRYGGYIVHVGIVLFYIGVLGSKGFQISHRQVLREGDTYEIAGYTLEVKEPFQERGANATYQGIKIHATKNGKDAGELRPAKGFYDNAEAPTYEAAILRRPGGDLYIALGELTEDGRADMQIFYNPLAWMVLWLAPAVIVIGALLSFAEGPRKARQSEGVGYEAA